MARPAGLEPATQGLENLTYTWGGEGYCPQTALGSAIDCTDILYPPLPAVYCLPAAAQET